jgi:hypothetical protein
MASCGYPVMVADPDLASVRGEAWFMELVR